MGDEEKGGREAARSRRPVTLLAARRASPVAAIDTGAGVDAILGADLADNLRTPGRDVTLEEVGENGSVHGAVARDFRVADSAARLARAATEAGRLPVLMAGSCHIGLAGVAGLPGGRRGVVWMDAHGDVNTPSTTGSGLLDGMVVSTVLGWSWESLARSVAGFAPVAEEDVLLVGTRDLDSGEEELLGESAVRVLGPGTPDADVRAAVLDLVDRVDALYVHIDLDVLDPAEGRANRLAVPDGLSAEALLEVCDLVASGDPVRSLGLASYDPAGDAEGRVARLAVRAVSAFAG